jgi:chorismate mutase
MATDPPATTTSGELASDTLESYRASIDNIDAAIIHLLAERFKITRKVGDYKRVHRLPPADLAREEAQIARLRALAHDADLDPEFGEAVIRFIISEVIRHHEKAGS